jgi:hypothetical protein
MIGTPIPADRFFCGRIHRRPVLIALLDRWGWHKERFHYVGEHQVRWRWVKARRPGRSVYTCRKPMNHWRLTIMPQGTRWVNQIEVRNIVKRGHRAVFKTRKAVRVQIPTEAWELGHRYEWTRWEEE